MRRLMQGSGVRRSRSGVRDGKVIARLEEFAGACAQARPDHRAGPWARAQAHVP